MKLTWNSYRSVSNVRAAVVTILSDNILIWWSWARETNKQNRLTLSKSYLRDSTDKVQIVLSFDSITDLNSYYFLTSKCSIPLFHSDAFGSSVELIVLSLIYLFVDCVWSACCYLIIDQLKPIHKNKVSGYYKFCVLSIT